MNCSFASEGSPCSAIGSRSILLPLEACNGDISKYLQRLGVSGKRGWATKAGLQFTERDVILNRAGLFSLSDEEGKSLVICPKHRADLTVEWAGGKRVSCCYPTHKAKKGNRKQSKNPRRVNFAISQEIFAHYKRAVPVGSAICGVCRAEHYRVREAGQTGTESDVTQIDEPLEVTENAGPSGLSLGVEEQASTLPPETSESEDTATLSQSSQHSSIPEEEISIWSDEVHEQQLKRKTLNEALSNLSGGRISPVLSTLNTSWDDISSTQQKYYMRKTQEAIATALTVISPGQEQELWHAIRKQPSVTTRSAKRKSFDPKSGMIDVLIKAYEQAESWQTKRQILSLFANDFSRSELQGMLPSLSKWRIDQARQHSIEVGQGQPLPEIPIFRTRISSVQVDHFIDFISRPEMIQDVAFGTKTLKLDSGEHIVIPAVVRTVIPSRIIEQYTAYCAQQDFEPAGQRSLYRMIKVCAASMQTCLQGLDNITAEGTEAIDNMHAVVKTLADNGASERSVESIQGRLKESKRYLKVDFKTHVGKEERCADHCTTHALSDPEDPQLQGVCELEHEVECSRCSSLEVVLMEIEREISNADMPADQQSRLRHEFKQNCVAIKAWKSHLLRTINQEESKQDVLHTLDKESCLVIMDWAMKYLPQRYRERMSEFFGKRGRSWHVSAVITKNEGGFQVECFVHVFNSCTQNSFAVASIVEHLFTTIRKELPLINKAYLRSDNAGCYHSGALILSLPTIGKRTGIRPVRYDFSDPQSGKDICDRKTASMKAHIRKWVNEKHDVISAEDMKVALESHGGVKGCRVAVVQTDPTKEMAANKIPRISLLNNYLFESSGVRVWRAYGIGSGRLLSYKELQIEPQGPTALQIIQPFGPRTQSPGVTRQASVPRAAIFSCNEPSCILNFKSQEDAEAHMDIGSHVGEEEDGESLFDKVRKRWAAKVTDLNVAPNKVPRLELEEAGPSATASQAAVGWALKTVKRSQKMGEKAKAFLIEKFNVGAASRNKADPIQVAREMQFAKDDTGKPYFTPEEWRTAQQISSFFSRLSARQRQQQQELEADESDLEDEDFEAIVQAERLQTLRQSVHDAIDTPDHPIQVDNLDLCEMHQSGKLETLKLPQLRELCTTLQLKVQGSNFRKHTFITALEQLLLTCSCKNIS